MILNLNFIKAANILLLLILVTACTPQKKLPDFTGTWMVIEKSGTTYERIDCGYPQETLNVTRDSVYHKGVMEDFEFRVDHIREETNQSTLFHDKEERGFYRFVWVDQQRGIAKWEVNDGNTVISRYFVNQLNIENIRTVKGTKNDCLTSEDTLDRINDSLRIDGGSKMLYVKDDNCIVIKNSKGEDLYERCFDGVTVKIRNLQGSFLPLTFISGSKAIDADFYKEGHNWTSKTVSYSGSMTKEIPLKQSMAISINEFDFENIVTTFDALIERPQLDVSILQNAGKLQDLDVYKIADILQASPVNPNNVILYRKAAHELINEEMYNEARIILLELVGLLPKDADLFLDLGDAQWGFDDQDAAKKSYQVYIGLLNSGDSGKVPQRVRERIK